MSSHENDQSHDNTELFNAGRIALYAPVQRQSRDYLTNAQMAELTRGLNSEAQIRSRFIDIQPLYRRDLTGIGFVQVMLPTSQYAYGGVMVMAVRESLVSSGLESGDSVVPTDATVDLESSLQHEYYRQILASIQAQEDVALPDAQPGKPHVIAFENASASISTEEHRLPRTIALPHAQVIRDGGWIFPEEHLRRPHGFKLEQTILQNEELFRRFNTHWTANFSSGYPFAEIEPLDIYLRGVPPYGYTIDPRIAGSDDIDQQARRVVAALQANHAIYSDFVRSEMAALDESRLKRRGEFQTLHRSTEGASSVADFMSLQPSYRTYIYYQENRLRITICPMFLASVGALEALNTVVDRSPNNVLLYSDEQIATFTALLINRVRQILGE